MKVFVASSRKFYDKTQQIVLGLQEAGVGVEHPYFHLENIPEGGKMKELVTYTHFPEIASCDMMYIYNPGGYIGLSVCAEMTFAYARGLKIFLAEPSEEGVLMSMKDEIIPVEEFLDSMKAIYQK